MEQAGTRRLFGLDQDVTFIACGKTAKAHPSSRKAAEAKFSPARERRVKVGNKPEPQSGGTGS
jgi:hypothetical protein